MSTIYELAEKGKAVKKEDELKQKANKEKFQKHKTKTNFFGSFRYSGPAGIFLYIGSLGVFWYAMMPLIDKEQSYSSTFNIGMLAFGICVIIFTFLFVYINIIKTKAWINQLPFKMPSYYINFINSKFSTFSRYWGRSYYEIGIEIEFKYEIDKELAINAIMGMKKKGISVSCKNQTDRYIIDELENPETSTPPPEDDQEYFNTPDESESDAKKREEIRVIDISGKHFANGFYFHKYFKCLCEEVLIPLHKEYTLINIRLSNQGEMKFMRE